MTDATAATDLRLWPSRQLGDDKCYHSGSMPTLLDVQKYLKDPETARWRRRGTGNLAVRIGRPDILARFVDPVTGRRRFIGTGVVPENYKGKNAVDRAVEDALDWLDKAIRNPAASKGEVAPEAQKLVEGLTVAQVCEIYLDWLAAQTERNKRKRSALSVADAERKLRLHVLPWIGGEPADLWAGLLDPERGAKNMEALKDVIARTPRRSGPKDKPLSLSSIQGPLRSLVAAYNHCKRLGYVRTVPPATYDAEPAREGEFSKEDATALLRFFDPSTRPMFAIAMNTGLRAEQELLMMTWEDIDWEQGGIKVPGERTKNGKGRYVPLLDYGAMDLLRESRAIWEERFSHMHQRVFFWRDDRGGAVEPGAPIAGFHHAFKAAMARAAAALNRPALAERIPHDCRRSFVTILCKEHPDFIVDDVMELTGHLSAEMARRYNMGNRRAAQKMIRARDERDGRPAPSGRLIEMPARAERAS